MAFTFFRILFPVGKQVITGVIRNKYFIKAKVVVFNSTLYCRVSFLRGALEGISGELTLN